MYVQGRGGGRDMFVCACMHACMWHPSMQELEADMLEQFEEGLNVQNSVAMEAMEDLDDYSIVDAPGVT